MNDWITVTVVDTKGSTPRESGTEMRIFSHAQMGTIGGGRLEFEATEIARDMLAQGKTQTRHSFPLGPGLGQCCGGAVVLDFIAGSQGRAPTHAPLWVWGAGHVGRAIVAVLAPFKDPLITWIDTSHARFPTDIPDTVSPLIAADPLRVVAHAPKDAHHLILTYSHDIDLALCDALLRHGFSSAGLIGSTTKWTRFRKRLSALGHSETDIADITCPIGIPSLGKHPMAIAVGIATQLLNTGAPATVKRDVMA
ncbi:MAG: xanthine dehydrogenase accessory protein XdhC [Aliishimia sp.]